MAGSVDDFQTIKCPACGGANPPDAARCQFCGEPLDDEAAAPPEDAAPMEDIAPPKDTAPPEDDDALDDLRAHFEGEIDRSRKPTSPLHKPQTDFSFGQPGGEQDEDAPAADAFPDDEPASEGIPEWLSAYGEPEDEAQEDIPTPEPEAEEPDWLADMGEPESIESLPPAFPLDDDTSPEPEAPPEHEPSAEPATDEDIPVWLSELGKATEASETAETLEPPEPVEEEDEPPAEPLERPSMPAAFGGDVPRPLVDAGTPDWLSGAPQAEVEEGIPTPDETAEVEDEAEAVEAAPPPDWLGEFDEVEEEEPAGVESPVVAEEAAPEEDIATPDEPLEEAAPEEAAAPDWVGEFTITREEAAEVEASTVEEEIFSEPVPDLEMEPDLEPVAEAAPEPEPAEEEELPEPPLDEDDAFDWLDALDDEEGFDMPPDEAYVPTEGEDLLGLSGGLAPGEPTRIEEAESLAEEEEAAEPGEVPEWIASLQAEEAAPEEIEAPELTPEEALAQQLEGLRYERITGEPPDSVEENPEVVGALKDVTGVIQPEMIFEGTELTVEAPVEETGTSEEEIARIALVEDLLAAEAEPVTVGEDGRGGLPVIRWIVALVLIAVVALPVLTGQTFFTQAGAGDGVRPAYETLDVLADGPATVLAAFEYGPETAAEMEPLASAVLAHLATGGDVTVLTVSTKPTGPAMAQAVLEQPGIAPRLAAEGGTWTNLGFVAGQASGISALALGPPPGVASPLAADYRGEPTDLPAASLARDDFDLVLVFAAQPEDLRAWIEQAGQPTGVPLLAGMSARAAPFALPYEQSGQVVAVLNGVNDAVAYGALANGAPPERAAATWNAQALGGVTAAVLIIAGGIIAALLPRRSRPERRR